MNEPFTLKLGGWSNLSDAPGTRIFFANVLQDTRCPQDVNCFQAGSVRVAVTVESNDQVARLNLSSLRSDYRSVGTFNGYVVRFIDIAPARQTANTPIPPGDYQVTLQVNSGSLNVSPARFNEPFTLKLGQTTLFQDSDLHMTFEEVKEDSRCPVGAICASAGTATVAVRLVYDRANHEQIILGVNGTPVATSFPIVRKVSGSVRTNALTPYPQREFASKEINPKDYTATFVVINPVAAPATVTPGALETCSDLTRADAETILGEAVKAQPAEIVLFPPPNQSITVHGLCGYGSVAYYPQSTASQNPRVLPADLQSDHAVIAGKLADGRRLEQLLSIVSAIDAANPRGRSSLYDRLLTYWSAGMWSPDVLGSIPEAAQGATNVRVSKVGSLGDSAIWVWREFDGGHYAALLAEKGDTLFVTTALTSEQRSENSLLAAMTATIQNMLR